MLELDDNLSVQAESLLVADKLLIHFTINSPNQSQVHYFYDPITRSSVKVEATALRELNFSQIEERYVVYTQRRWYTLEYLGFKYPVSANFEVSLFKINYCIPEGAKGTVILVPITTTCSPYDVKASSFLDYVNHHSSFRFRGLVLDLSEKLPHIGMSGLFKSPGRKRSQKKVGVLMSPKSEETELSQSQRYQSFVQEYMVRQRTTVVENMHLHLSGCEPGSLLVLLLAEFDTLQDMDAIFGKGRFATSLATRIALSQSKWGFFLFENNLLFLHSQAEALGLSLQSVYEGAVLKVKEQTVNAPDGENPFKSKVAEDKDYLAHLYKTSRGHRRRL